MLCLRFRALLLALSLVAAVRPAAAQECVGIPSGGRGFLTYGFEGTDGATGDGLSFAYRRSSSALLLQRRSLDDFVVVDDLGSVEAQASVRLPALRLPVCLVAGVGRLAYDNEQEESRVWTSEDPGYVTARNRVGGPYRRLRVPVGIGAGWETRLGPVALVPFVAPALVYESESYRPERAPERERSGWGVGASGGLTVAAGWLVVRSTLSHAFTRDRSLSDKNNFPLFSLHAGVRF